MTQRTARIALTAFLLAVALATHWLAGRAAPQLAQLGVPASPTPTPRDDGFVYVKQAVDGDTIELADGTRVRYVGVDTPETVHPNKPVQCFGKEASAYNAALVEGTYVRLERDITDTDMYGRQLRYVYLEDGTFVNRALVADGYAYAYTYPPDIGHAAEFKALQAEAKAAGRGLWASCPAKK